MMDVVNGCCDIILCRSHLCISFFVGVIARRWRQKAVVGQMQTQKTQSSGKATSELRKTGSELAPKGGNVSNGDAEALRTQRSQNADVSVGFAAALKPTPNGDTEALKARGPVKAPN